MVRSLGVAGLAMAVVFQAATALGQSISVSGLEAATWLRWVVPLPKQVSIPAKQVVPLEGVAIRLRQGAGDVEQFAADQLRAILACKQRGESRFELLLGVCDAEGRLEGQVAPGAAELARLPNREQAYLITPLGENRIVLTGLDPRGVSYAAATFGQLVRPKVADGKVELPLARITDWPDLAERGIWWRKSPSGKKTPGLWWGQSGYDDGTLDWFAGLKLNHQEIRARLLVEKGKPATATLDTAEENRCRLRAIRMVPVVSHLEQLGGSGILAAYPEAKGQGKHPSFAQVICFSQPTAQRVFDEWFLSLARTVQSDDVMVWLSENPTYCKCEQCKPTEQYQHEMQVLVHALREAQKVRPAMRLRLLLTQGTYPQNLKILASAPQDVGISYYDGGRTYSVARQPMITPAMREAIRGRWFGCYPTLSGTWYELSPFAGAAYMKERMGELHEVGAKSLAGFAPPSLRSNEFSLSAAAEYAWNTKGRSPREFVLAWATRHQYPDPERVAQWWEQIEEPQRDVYITNVTSEWYWSGVNAALKGRRAAKPGAGLLSGFPKEGHLEADLAAVRRAVTIAEAIPDQRFLHETRYTLALLEMVSVCRDLTVCLEGRKELDEKDKAEAAAMLKRIELLFQHAREELAATDRCIVLYPHQEREPATDWFPWLSPPLKPIAGKINDTAKTLGVGAL